jgi:hypothetical protein
LCFQNYSYPPDGKFITKTLGLRLAHYGIGVDGVQGTITSVPGLVAFLTTFSSNKELFAYGIGSIMRLSSQLIACFWESNLP